MVARPGVGKQVGEMRVTANKSGFFPGAMKMLENKIVVMIVYPGNVLKPQNCIL